MKHYGLRIGLLLGVWGFGFFSQAQTAPSLQEIIDSALTNDYKLQNKELTVKLSELDQERIKDAYMPKFEMDAKGGYLYSAFDLTTPAFALPSLGIAMPETNNRYRLGSAFATANLKGSILLYGGGQVSNLKKANAAKIGAETAMLEKDRQEIISQVLTVYDQLGMLKEVKKMLDESQKRLDENKKTAEKAFSYGIITKYEYQKIELAESQLRSKFEEYEGKRQLVLLQLNLLTNIDMSRLQLLDSDLTVWVTGKQDNIDSRPELVALQQAITANEYKLKAAKNWWVPKIGASASLGYIGLYDGKLTSKDPTVLTGQRLDYKFENFNVFPIFNAGIGLKWELFDGREGITAVKQAKIEKKMAENNQTDAVNKLNVNLQKAEIELKIADDQLLVKEKSREIAQNAMNQATQEFKVGLIKSTQLIEAENDLQQAIMEYAQAVFNQRRAAAEYLKAAGKLTPQEVK